MAFDILDRLTGEWTVIKDGGWLEALAESMIVKTPTLWFLINLVFWLLLGLGLIKFMRHLGYVAQGTITVRLKIYKAIHKQALDKFISRKLTSVEERDYFARNDIVKITWTEKDKRAYVVCVWLLCFVTHLSHLASDKRWFGHQVGWVPAHCDLGVR